MKVTVDILQKKEYVACFRLMIKIGTMHARSRDHDLATSCQRAAGSHSITQRRFTISAFVFKRSQLTSHLIMTLVGSISDHAGY